MLPGLYFLMLLENRSLIYAFLVIYRKVLVKSHYFITSIECRSISRHLLILKLATFYYKSKETLFGAYHHWKRGKLQINISVSLSMGLRYVTENK